MTSAQAARALPVLTWKDHAKDLAKSLSLVNLIHLRLWSELLTYSRTDLHFTKHPPSPTHYYAILTDIVAISLVLWGGISMARKVQDRKSFGIARFAFVLALLTLANALREVLAGRNVYLRGQLFRVVGTNGVILLGLAGLGLVAFLLWKWTGPILAGASGLLLAFSPFVLFTFAGAATRIVQYKPEIGADNPPAASLPLAARPTDQRVVWIVFDELDYRLLFVDRPAGLPLPEFDRFRDASLHASNAFPPSGSTTLSLPAMITGELLEDYTPTGPAQASMAIAAKPGRATWADLPTAFTRARAMGFNTGMFGWYLPYCRVLNGLNSCWWEDLELQANTSGSTFAELVVNQPRSLVETNLFSPFSGSLGVEARIRRYTRLLNHSIQAARDPAIGFAMLHLQPPHAPYIYSRSTQRFSGGQPPIGGYFDSVALADRALGEIRGAMEKSGLWESTTVLVTSDHWYRTAQQLDGKFDRRVPFMLKLRGQQQGVPYSTPFNTYKTSELLLGILGGGIRTTEDVSRWLDTHVYGSWPPSPTVSAHDSRH